MPNNLLFFVERSLKTNNLRVVQPGLFVKDNEQLLVYKDMLRKFRSKNSFNLLYGITDIAESEV